MRKASGALSWIVVLSLLCASWTLKAEVQAPAVDGGSRALAERLAEMGQAALRGTLTTAYYRLTAALMESAAKLDPEEPRYPRLWADAALQAGDADNALRALKVYTNLVRDDKPALIQLADLYVRTYQTVDARLNYLRGVVDVTGLPDEVRSHLAYLIYQACAERAQATQADAALDKALKLNPLNLEALRARNDLVANGAPAQRLAAQLALVKANPAQLLTMTRIAGELADAGLALQSVPFYDRGISLARAQGVQIQREYVLAYATELALLQTGQLASAPQIARQLTDVLINSEPGDYDALIVRLLLQRQSGPKEDAVKTTQQALNALSNRLQVLRQTIGNKTATTRPVDLTDAVVWGSFDDDIARLRDLKASDKIDPQHLRSEFNNLLADIAWFEIYFDGKPAAAQPAIDALRKMLPETSPVLVRLDGWSFLARGEKDQAKVKLSAVKDKDPRAQLGLLKMAGPSAKKEGDAFLAAHPTGLIALETLDALKDANVVLVPDPAKADALLEVYKTFPQNWLTILDAPQTFYLLRTEPVKVPHAFAEPLLVKVSLQNVSDMPITIGSDGVLHPELLFDAQIRSVMAPEMQKELPAVAVERVAREMVLKPKQTISQTVRLDQGQLNQLLSSNPAPSLQVTFDVRVNPTATGVGPAGQMMSSARFLDRGSFPITADSVTRLGTSLRQSPPAEKIRDIDLALQIVMLKAQIQGDPDAAKMVQQLFELIKAARTDASESVQTWANAVVVRFNQPGHSEYVTQLVNDPNWTTRVIGLMAMAGQLPLAEQRVLLKKTIDHDANPVVVEVARDVSMIIEQAAATAATQPTTGPTSAPVTAPSPFTAQSPATQPASTAPAVNIPNLPLSLPPPSPSSATQPGK